jgi:hypothetical protein
MSRNIWKAWYKRILPTILFVIVVVPAAVLVVPAMILTHLCEWSIRQMKIVQTCDMGGDCEHCPRMEITRYSLDPDHAGCGDYVLDKEDA